jgi:hypothetical protein
MENNNLTSTLKIRKYRTEFRKKLVYNLEKNNTILSLINIYNIIIEDIGYNYSTNRNGIFINLNILSDKCIDKLLLLLDESRNNNLLNQNISNDNFNTSNYKFDDVEIITELGHKLTNQEKIYIKKIRKK